MPEIVKLHIPKRANNTQIKIKPIGIILHYVGNPKTTARANRNYFATMNLSENCASTQYIVDDKEIVEAIPPNMKACGTSKKAFNESYIQIEMCHPDTTGKPTEKTLDNVVWLCRKLIKEYGLTKVIRHYDVTGKKCPLYYVNNPTEWNKLQARILAKEESKLTVDEALKILQNKGVINSPEYWREVADVVKYFPDFLINAAKKVKNA